MQHIKKSVLENLNQLEPPISECQNDKTPIQSQIGVLMK